GEGMRSLGGVCGCRRLLATREAAHRGGGAPGERRRADALAGLRHPRGLESPDTGGDGSPQAGLRGEAHRRFRKCVRRVARGLPSWAGDLRRGRERPTQRLLGAQRHGGHPCRGLRQPHDRGADRGRPRETGPEPRSAAMTRYSPQIDVFGSYFPAWMVCIVAGIVLTVVVRQVLVALEIDPHLRPAGLVYLSLWVVFAL